MKKSLIVLIAIGTTLIGMWGCKPSKQYTGNIEKIKLGVATVESSSLIYIAEKKGFFKKHGLDVLIKNYEAGVLAVDALWAGEVEVATASEFVLTSQIFQKRDDLRVLASIGIANNMEIVASKEKGITEPTDLKRKKIGTVHGSILDFFLGTFLNSHGISITDVQVINLKPSETGEALSKGIVDAAVTFTPHSYGIKTHLGRNIVGWPAQGGQDWYLLLLVREPFIKTRPLVIERLIKALIDSEGFMEKHETEAQKIIAEVFKIDQPVLPSVWQKSRSNVRLDQDLLSLMEDEARWLIKNKLTDETEFPNYFDFIHLDGLEKVKPEAITIVH